MLIHPFNHIGIYIIMFRCLRRNYVKNRRWYKIFVFTIFMHEVENVSQNYRMYCHYIIFSKKFFRVARSYSVFVVICYIQALKLLLLSSARRKVVLCILLGQGPRQENSNISGIGQKYEIYSSVKKMVKYFLVCTGTCRSIWLWLKHKDYRSRPCEGEDLQRLYY